MYVARWIILSLVIVSILLASSPQMWAVTSQAWDDARPGVVQVMDGVKKAGIEKLGMVTDPTGPERVSEGTPSQHNQ